MGTAVQPCPGPPDPCKELLQQILDFIAKIQKRYWDLRNNEGNLPMNKPAEPDPRYGSRSITGERQQFEDTQRGLRNRLSSWDSNNCGPPPGDAWKWASEPVPEADPRPDAGAAAKKVATAGAAVGAGYIIYRVIRMIPSLFPPLWETIPANAAIP